LFKTLSFGKTPLWFEANFAKIEKEATRASTRMTPFFLLN
jgi:hypothetical protein